MAQDNKVGHGSLSQAKNRKSDNSPNMIGSLTFDEQHIFEKGDKIFLSAWSKVGQDNKKWLSINAELPQNKPRSAPAVKHAAEDDDEIPF